MEIDVGRMIWEKVSKEKENGDFVLSMSIVPIPIAPTGSNLFVSLSQTKSRSSLPMSSL